MFTTKPNLMPSLFNELLGWNANSFLSEERYATPKMNVIESNEDYTVELCVPGLKKEDLSLCIDTDNNLVVEMNKKEEKSNDDRRYLRHEFSQMQFKQSMLLPENAKKDKISAKVTDGILSIFIPKITEEEKREQAQMIAIA